jgi:hydrocephalus-inducing protein
MEEELPKEEPEVDYSSYLKGDRIMSEVPLHFNIPQLFRTGLEVVPCPIYPDPSTININIIK